MRPRRRLVALVMGIVLLWPVVAAPMAGGAVLLPTLPPLPSLPLVPPLPSIPLPSLPLPSIPVPSLSVPPLLPTPLPTVPPLVSLPPLVPTPIPAGTASTSLPATSTGPTASSGASTAPSATEDTAGGGAQSSVVPSPDGTAEAAAPVNPTVLPDDESAPSGALDGLVVPGLVIGVPMALAIAFLVAQLIGGVAVLPAVRRTLGSLGLRGGPATPVPEEEASS